MLLFLLIGFANANCDTTCAASATYCGASSAWIAACDDACAGNATLLECAECFRDTSDNPGQVAECVQCFNQAARTEVCDWTQRCGRDMYWARDRHCVVNDYLILLAGGSVFAVAVFCILLATCLYRMRMRVRSSHSTSFESAQTPTSTRRRRSRRERRTPGEEVVHGDGVGCY